MCFKSNQFLIPENINNERKYKKTEYFMKIKRQTEFKRKIEIFAFHWEPGRKQAFFSVGFRTPIYGEKRRNILNFFRWKIL